MEKKHFDQSDRLNEGKKVTLKRRYTENHPAITAGKTARIRNKMLEAIADGKITQDQFNAMLSELSADSKRWLKRNSKFFNVSEEGVTLTKSGTRVLNQIKTNTQPNVKKLVMESFSSFVNNESVNESKTVNEGYVKTRGYNEVEDRIERLVSALRPDSILCKSISKKADNVTSEFKKMQEHMSEIMSLWQEVEYTIAMSNKYESVSTEDAAEALCEATVTMDAMSPDDRNFLKWLGKNKVEIIDTVKSGPMGHPEITMQGKRKDLEKVLADCNFGWCDEDLAEYIEESVVNESDAWEDLKDMIEDLNDKQYKKYAKQQGFDTNRKNAESMWNWVNNLSGKEAWESQREIEKEILESVELNEAFKSSKLRNLMNMSQAYAYGKSRNLAKGLYGLTKVKLDQIEDHHLIDVDIQTAKQAAKDSNKIVFYIVDNQKSNPYADGAKYSMRDHVVAPGILGVTRGRDFLAVSYDQRETGNARKFDGRVSNSLKYSMTKGSEDAVGGNKVYRGYDASGISSIKRIAELSDRAIIFDMQAMKNFGNMGTEDLRQSRIDAKEGAIAFKNDKDFKKANMQRYKDILATKASKMPLDKMVEGAINELTKQIADAMKRGETTKYGEIKIGETPNGRELKLTDAANIMSHILGDYERYVRYVAEDEKQKGTEYYSGYYEKEMKEYAKRVSDRVKKVKDMDYAW